MQACEKHDLQIYLRDVQALESHPHNARTHTKHQIRQIAESIRVFGFTNPVLIDTTGRIIAGHGHVAAAKLLGIGEVPTILLDRLTEDQIRAYVIADNKLAENAGWDKEILAIELEYLMTLDGLDFDVTVTGFEIPEIDLMLHASAQETEKPEDAEVATGPAISRIGNIWLLGEHRLLCGNSLDSSSYALLMGGSEASVVFVDPPYNVAIDGHVSENGSVQHREFAMASGEMNEEQFVQFLTKSFQQLVRHSTAGSVHFVCMDWRYMSELLSAGSACYSDLLNLCV